MSWFFATIYDSFMRRTERACLGPWRRDLLSPLSGSVLEIGAGTGANLPYYPPSLERLVVTENDEHMLRHLRPAAEGERRRLGSVEVKAASADNLPFADESFDAVVSTLVLCTVPDPKRALAEVRRVLRPGGRFVFLEHVVGNANEPSRVRWQRRVEPVWRHLAAGCHLTRDTETALKDAGFAFKSLTRDRMKKALPIVEPTIRGIAHRV
jgi:ubiquinone/menaquinone biosynthesis C-methylase UbiE